MPSHVTVEKWNRFAKPPVMEKKLHYTKCVQNILTYVDTAVLKIRSMYSAIPKTHF